MRALEKKIETADLVEAYMNAFSDCCNGSFNNSGDGNNNSGTGSGNGNGSSVGSGNGNGNGNGNSKGN